MQQDGLEQVHGLMGLCASSWEYNYNPFRCLLGSGCRLVDYGRTMLISVGQGKRDRNIEEHTFRFFNRHLSHLGIPRCAGVGSGVYLHSRPAAHEQWLQVGSTRSHWPGIRKRRVKGTEQTNLEVVQTAVITPWFPSPPLPLRLTGHIHLRIWDSDGKLAVVTRLGRRLASGGRLGHIDYGFVM